MAQRVPSERVLGALLIGLDVGGFCGLERNNFHVVGRRLAEVALHAVLEDGLERKQSLGDQRVVAEQARTPDLQVQDVVLGRDRRVRRRELEALKLDAVVEHGVSRDFDAHVAVRLLHAAPAEELSKDLDVTGVAVLGRAVAEVPDDEAHLERHLPARDVHVLLRLVVGVDAQHRVHDHHHLPDRDPRVARVEEIARLARLVHRLDAPLLAEPPVLQVHDCLPDLVVVLDHVVDSNSFQRLRHDVDLVVHQRNVQLRRPRQFR
mmetsp:Transcript_30311/g.46526  ORF Transcript_30311/g.46526 Transcript_30311/m.46526 type:complete len:263 (-) Transcript_30311:66-854(-)